MATDGERGYEGQSAPPELSLTGRKETVKAVTSHLYSVREWFVLLCSALGAVLSFPEHSGSKSEKSDNVLGCHIEGLDRILPVGSTAPAPNKCMQYKCDSATATSSSFSAKISSSREGVPAGGAGRCWQILSPLPLNPSSAFRCAEAHSLKPCRVIEDKSKPYPECCPTFDCS
ncbi:hypothetical protein EVAR_17742_1 [Eumeta japonica]|uniref:Single domain-containing protein n=1 Tax=Eumeta variegata TaxID=151549 RepID=A0A4C1TTW8_EUMVA|nr:hypothetical protein EVAR_17742_1 [Eumeta japonica]